MFQKGYNAFNGISCMNVNWISQSCAKQRAGRAGRLCAGECYRLYTREHHNHMATHDVPEILRMPLQVIIHNIVNLFKNVLQTRTK